MGRMRNNLRNAVGAVVLGAGVVGVSISTGQIHAQGAETEAFEVARSAGSSDAVLEFINQFPVSPLGKELVAALPEADALAVCAGLPADVDAGLAAYCAEILNIQPAAGPVQVAEDPPQTQETGTTDENQVRVQGY